MSWDAWSIWRGFGRWHKQAQGTMALTTLLEANVSMNLLSLAKPLILGREKLCLK